jgi:molybdopterin-guanine dinucleotide biosynthesis protein A
MRYSAYIICGGASKRMGSCKAVMTYKGERFMDRMARIAIDAGFHPHFIVKSAQSITSLDFPVLVENEKKHHPLYGVRIALDHCPDEYALILPCDCLFIKPNSLSRFRNCDVPTIACGNQNNALIGWYPKSWSTKAMAYANNNSSVNEFAKEASILYFPTMQLNNCNRPEDI